MLKAMYRSCAGLLVLGLFLYSGRLVNAQVAPTTTATISGSVSDVAGKPVAGAHLTLSGPTHAVTQTDTNGLFVFVGVSFGEYVLSSAASGLGTATRNLSVQGDTNVAIQYEPASVNGLKTIAQVSSSANARFNITPASITQVNPIQNAFEGKTSWRTILEQIPGIAQAGLSNGSSVWAAYPDGPMVPVQISINGALPYETATLLDDMPLISSSLGAAESTSAFAGAGTDLSVYPLNSFASADVVRGPGASAPSIVDSIGGSFVLHAPGVVNANHYAVSLSTDPYGGIIANALAAVRWKKLSAVVTYGVNDSPGPANGAVVPASTLFTPSTVNGSFCSCPSYSFLSSPNYAFSLYGVSNGLLICCYQESTAWSQHSGSLALNYELSPAVSAGVFYAGQVSQQSQPYQDYTVEFNPPAGYSGAIPAGQLILPQNGFLLAQAPDQNASALLEEKITARIGNGVLKLAALQNRVFSTNVVSTPTSATLQLFGSGALCATSTPSCGTAGNPGTLTMFNGDKYNVTFPLLDCDNVFASNNRDLLLEYSTSLGTNLRAGVSFVKSYYNIPIQRYCDYGGFFTSDSTLPSADSQTTNELRLFVGGNPSEKTSIDLSMYFANAAYHVQNPSDLTGNTYVDAQYSYAAPRIGFVWRPTAAVAIRASAGGGFAEAPLADLAGIGISGGNANGTPMLGPGYYEVTQTNINLQPEKSFGFDLGTDIRLRHNTVMSFDVYHTNLYGQLYNSTSPTGTYLGLPLFTTQYGNLGESRYEGILLDLRHDAPHGIYWALSGGLTRGYVVSLPANFYNAAGSVCDRSTGANCTNVNVVTNINFSGTFTTASIPYAQGLGTFGYRWNSDKYVDVVGTYYGNNNTYFHPAFVELDGHVGYPLTKDVSLLLTFRNITGIYDGATQVFSLNNLSGAPTVAGAPYPLTGEEYGPRTVLLTTSLNL